MEVVDSLAVETEITIMDSSLIPRQVIERIVSKIRNVPLQLLTFLVTKGIRSIKDSKAIRDSIRASIKETNRTIKTIKAFNNNSNLQYSHPSINSIKASTPDNKVSIRASPSPTHSPLTNFPRSSVEGSE